VSEAAPSHLISEPSTLLQDVVEGLQDFPKRLPCKHFYDRRGSQLFDRICELDEYYLTRTEQHIMHRFADEMGHRIGPRAAVIELGSGSSVKTRDLLDHLIEPAAYVPVDISHQHLQHTAAALRNDYPGLNIAPVTADFTAEIPLPETAARAQRRVVYFPGSTIGNFEPADAGELLKTIAALVGPDGGLLIGVDLVKDVATLERAYDDTEGVTAEFNLNLMRRIRDELNADIDLNDFRHVAFFNEAHSRVEIYIKSLVSQSLHIGEQTFALGAGEMIHTEYSHKYTVERFSELAADSGFERQAVWTDPKNYFAVMFFHLDG
jgi:dimethylhistidine N-methyltransferase